MKKFLLLSIVLNFVCIQNSFNATITWVGTTSVWSLASNWNPATIPGISDKAVIGTSGATPIISTEVIIDELEINRTAGVVALTLGGNIRTNKLYLINGIISTGLYYSITILNTNWDAIQGYSSNSYISISTNSKTSGSLKRYIVSPVSYDFPIGNATSYQLINLDISSISGGLSYIEVSFDNSATNLCSSNNPGSGLPLTESTASYFDLLNNGGTSGGIWTVSPDKGSADYSITLNGMSYSNAGSATNTVLKRSHEIFFEDFAGAVLPIGWQNIKVLGNATDFFVFNKTNPCAATTPAAAGLTYPFAMFDNSNCVADFMVEQVELITPEINASAYSTVFLQFNQYWRKYGARYPKIFVSNDNGATYTLVYTLSATTTVPLCIDITANAAGYSQVKIKFQWNGNWDYYWIIDNVRVTTADKPWTLEGNYVSSTDNGTVVSCQRSGLLGFSQFAIGINNTPVVTPIKLISFVGKKDNKANVLKWSTATETNNDFFSIERSDNLNKWIVLFDVKGAGNSNKVIDYSAKDNNPPNKINYYRLKQTDFDGKYTYSNTVIINNDLNKDAPIRIYPNPVNEKLYVEINKIEANTFVEVYNSTNELAIKIPIINNNTIVDISKLAKGFYYIKIKNSNNVFIDKFIKE